MAERGVKSQIRSPRSVPAMRLGGAILTSQQLADGPREMLILQAMAMEDGAYEWIQHVEIARGVGVSQEKIDAIAAGNLDHPAFDAAERALLAFGAEVEAVRVSDATFDAARAHYTQRELVEAIVAMGFYMMLARVTEATKTPIDAVEGMAWRWSPAPRAARARGAPTRAEARSLKAASVSSSGARWRCEPSRVRFRGAAPA